MAITIGSYVAGLSSTPLFGIVTGGSDPWDVLWENGTQSSGLDPATLREISEWPRFDPAVTGTGVQRGIVVASFSLASATDPLYLVAGIEVDFSYVTSQL